MSSSTLPSVELVSPGMLEAATILAGLRHTRPRDPFTTPTRSPSVILPSVEQASPIDVPMGAARAGHTFGTRSTGAPSPSASYSSGKPRLLKLKLRRPKNTTAIDSTPIPVSQAVGPPNAESGRSGLKLKLRCIQSALHPSSPTPIAGAGHKRKIDQLVTQSEDDNDSEADIMPPKRRMKQTAQPPLPISAPTMKRNKRILDPKRADHAALIATAAKAGNEYYDSDVGDVAGDVKDTTKPELFRNVTWGAYATDYADDDNFKANPEFTQFVPGRFELLADGTAFDQKHKLVVKLLDKNGKKRIFANPPPRNWASQEAITALNKRTVQQIRRNTSVRFREVVQAYVAEERKWILANLTAGKPTKGWKAFVEAFNQTFGGKILAGTAGARPLRSHSSLTKEVERFGADFYMKGRVPVTAKKVVKKE
ncbi:hypothetical protein J4E90_008799 [Alternaria incomplexa]|uniref:uncharacterized protein n=1 Tax=Alternaria incomplexa TaxID=1187928 RepID=UPI0022212904|nr:uncharacterized protein J4E90_008799 [Alternaria incomplexa]KAI4908175.1 hypothetical protein J4E90_008799 [Alternaria incomplexa]